MNGTTARVEHTIRSEIAAMRPGERLPSERTMVENLRASRSTVRLVLARLVAEGLLRAEAGRGYFVTARPPEPPWP